MNPSMLSSLKLGFLGAGNLAKNLIQGYLDHSPVKPENIFISLRSRKNLLKNQKISLLCNNEDILEKAQIIFLCVKPHDLEGLLNELKFSWQKKHTVLSPVAGISFKKLKKWGMSLSRVIRFMPNTNVCAGSGMLPFCSLKHQENLNSFAEEVLRPLGWTQCLKEESSLEPLTVACASGSSFILEIMLYWLEWLSEQGFDEYLAKEFVIQSFLGTSLMAKKRKNQDFSALQKEICSQKGVSAEGLKALREMDLERILRLSFEQSLLKLKKIECS